MYEKVLLAEDDSTDCMTMRRILAASGITVEIANSARDTSERIRSGAYSLMIINIRMLEDGFDIIRNLRFCGDITPIILTCENEDLLLVTYGLAAGADEYISKPFNPMMLVPTVKALIRRSRGFGMLRKSIATIGPFEYDLDTLRLFKNGVEIMLSLRELEMMKIFLNNPGRIQSRENLYHQVWGEGKPDDNAVSVYIKRLRDKIEDNSASPVYIRNVRNMGYVFMLGGEQNIE